MTNRRRVVVTGIGLVSSLGIGTEANWAGIKAGQSGIGTITKFDTTHFATRIAGEVKKSFVDGGLRTPGQEPVLDHGQ